MSQPVLHISSLRNVVLTIDTQKWCIGLYIPLPFGYFWRDTWVSRRSYPLAMTQ
jgi:hypothetical protein